MSDMYKNKRRNLCHSLVLAGKILLLCVALGVANLQAEEKSCEIKIISNPRLPIEPGGKIEVDTSTLKNIVINPTFMDKSGWSLGDKGSGTVTLDDKVFRSSPYSVRNERPVDGAYGYVNQDISGLLLPNTAYYAECYIRTNITGEGYKRGALLNVNLVHGEEEKVSYNPLQRVGHTTNDWTKVCGLFQTHSDLRAGGLWGIFNTTGTAWFDDFFLAPLYATITYTIDCPNIKQVKLLNEDGEILAVSGVLKEGINHYEHTVNN